MPNKVGFARKAPGGMSTQRIRATPTERTLASVCREAGATVRCNTRLRNLNIGVSVQMKEREVVASGLPFHHGPQLAVDIMLRRATTAAGLLCTNAAHTNGAVLYRARMEKAVKVLGTVGGRSLPTGCCGH